MKTTFLNSSGFWLGITTLLLVAVSILTALDTTFSWVFFLTFLGQVLLVYTVYRVLRTPRRSQRTFDDWYEDHDVTD